jgi:antirestriction protein ArdC
MKRDLYAEVSARIVAELEAGAAPWVKPWSATAGANTPCNAVTNRPYSGCNVVLLWMAQAAGYRSYAGDWVTRSIRRRGEPAFR